MKLGQTKRVVLMEFVLVLIPGFFIAYMLLPDPVPPALSTTTKQLFATPVPDRSRTFPVVPEAKPALSETLPKVKVTRKIEQPNKVPAPVPIPVVDTRDQINSELAPAPKQVLTPAPEPKMVLEVKPVVPPGNQFEQAPVPMKMITVAPEPKPTLEVKPAEPPVTQTIQASVPKKVLPPVTETKVPLAFNPAEPADNAPEPVTEQSILPTQKLLPAESPANPSTTDSEKSSTRMMVAGTVAAVVFAPIAVPASIIFGFAVGMFTPTASKLGQKNSLPTKQKHGKQPGNTPGKQPENTSEY